MKNFTVCSFFLGRATNVEKNRNYEIAPLLKFFFSCRIFRNMCFNFGCAVLKKNSVTKKRDVPREGGRQNVSNEGTSPLYSPTYLTWQTEAN